VSGESDQSKLEVQEPREAHHMHHKWRKTTKACLLSSCTNRELGDRLCVFENGMLQKFAKKNEKNGGLDLP
jgi:hypothetical protein